VHLVINCYASGDVNCPRDSGGLIGLDNFGGAANCYSTGHVTGNQDVGGLIGFKYTTDGFVSCFWDADINPDVNGIGNGSDPNVVGKTTEEMMKEDTFNDTGWDVVEVWGIGENQTYPYLRKYPAGDINHDGIVNFLDFAILAAHWLEGM
jgi:hypothetical protein